jgi:hypothetical protein
MMSFRLQFFLKKNRDRSRLRRISCLVRGSRLMMLASFALSQSVKLATAPLNLLSVKCHFIIKFFK